MPDAQLLEKPIAIDPREEQLVRAVLAGERGAWERLAEPHRRHVRALVGCYAQDSDEADDLVQEILLHAYRKLTQFRSDSRFATWLHTIAVRMCLTHQRLRKPRNATLDAVAFAVGDRRPGSNTERAALARVEADAILRVVEALPPHLRAVLLLRAAAGLSEVEIARELGLRPGTVKSRLHRARALMRLHFG